MTIVNDFDEIPLRAQGLIAGRKNGKHKSSSSLQQELDLNLKKLNELELSLNKKTTSSNTKGIY